MLKAAAASDLENLHEVGDAGPGDRVEPSRFLVCVLWVRVGAHEVERLRRPELVMWLMSDNNGERRQRCETQPEARSCVTVRSGLVRVPAQIGQRRTR